MTEIVLLYILTGITAAGLILSILLLQKYGAARAEIAALKTEQQRLAALQTEETRRSSQETAQMLQAMQTGIQTNLQTGMQAFSSTRTIKSSLKKCAGPLTKNCKRRWRNASVSPFSWSASGWNRSTKGSEKCRIWLPAWAISKRCFPMSKPAASSAKCSWARF